MPVPFAAIAVGISALSSGVNLVSGLSRKAKAKKALRNFKRQKLKNVTEGMRVSTLGAEFKMQEASRRFSTSVDALRSGGVRGVVGGLGRQEQIQQAGMQQITADLDRQQMMIDRMAAQDEARIRQMRENRENAAIAGLGKEISEGRNQAMAGAAGLAKSAVAASQVDWDGGGAEFKGSGITNQVADTAESLGTKAIQATNTGGDPSVFAGAANLANQSLNSFGANQDLFGNNIMLQGKGFDFSAFNSNFGSGSGKTGSVDVGQGQFSDRYFAEQGVTRM